MVGTVAVMCYDSTVIYFYYGENGFAIQRRVTAVTTKFDEQYGAEAVTHFDATEIEPQELIAGIVNIDLLATRRLIVVRGLDNAKVAWEKLGDNLGRVPDDTDLVIVVAKPDKRTRTYKDLLGSAQAHEFSMLRPQELRKWLLDETRTAKLTIDTAAINELLTITSGDANPQARLATEIAKFQALNRPINVDLVRQIVEPNLATNAFAILNLALAGQRAEAGIELRRLRESGEDANKFFGLLASQIFALAAAIHTDVKAETARQLKIHPFQLSKARQLARVLGDEATSRQRIKKITRLLADTDAKIKQSRADEAWTLVEVALMKPIV